MYDYQRFSNILKKNPVVPVVAIENAEDALPLCETLISNGINIIEITLRTEAAIDAIKAVINSKIKIFLGAGTVYTSDQFERLEDIGVDFIVSPGTTDDLLNYAQMSKMAYLPGVMTSSEILKVRNCGFKFQKLFPANIAGGLNALKAYSSVYSDVKFCPTGGVNSSNFVEFLSKDNVCAVGGTWIADSNSISTHNWDVIAKRANDIDSIRTEPNN